MSERLTAPGTVSFLVGERRNATQCIVDVLLYTFSFGVLYLFVCVCLYRDDDDDDDESIGPAVCALIGGRMIA